MKILEELELEATQALTEYTLARAAANRAGAAEREAKVKLERAQYDLRTVKAWAKAQVSP